MTREKVPPYPAGYSQGKEDARAKRARQFPSVKNESLSLEGHLWWDGYNCGYTTEKARGTQTQEAAK